MENKTKMPKRCCMKDCKKKLGIIKMSCKCGKFFCIIHRLPENHNCTYDFETEGKKRIEKENPVVVNPKLNKI